MPPEIEELVLNAVKLKFEDDGKLNIGKGFNNFAELAASIARLLSKNIRYL
jgi:hypothetical protein